MIFASPWLLLALAALPILWWLLRVTPPAPKQEVFPAIRLLLGLNATAETPARTPWWLLAMRMLAAALIIVGLARPILEAGSRLPGDGPVLLVLDDGWASASDWARRIAAAETALDRADRAGRQAALLATAPSESGAAPQATTPMPPAELRTRVAALRPEPWPSDRAASTKALLAWETSPASRGGSVVYIADGLTDGEGWPDFAKALGEAGPVIEVRADAPPAQVLLPPRSEADRLVARIAQTPRATPTDVAVLAQSGDGRTLARVPLHLDANAATAEAPIALPPELRNRLSRLVLEGPASAGSVVLLDERWRRRPVGLLAGDETTANTPLSGALFYLRNALAPFTELREGDLKTLLSRELSVLILADHVVADGPERQALDQWVQKGGLLIRFAGPEVAEHADSLLPVRLLAGDRQLGGAMSWSQPAGLAPFGANTPFAGLPVPEEVRVNRQVLAEPGARLADETWARLADGTPLVTQAVRGAGRVVLFHVTANADWSDLPLSGLFVDMLRRLVELSAGVSGVDDTSAVPLAPAEMLDGFGQMAAPPPAAIAVTAKDLALASASPRHPPGMYGPESARRVLNLSARLDLPRESPAVAGASERSLGGIPPERALAPWLLAAALALLAVDLLLSLRLRGLMPKPSAASSRSARLASLAALVFAGLLAVAPARADEPNFPPGPNPALVTRLAYIVTGDDQVDGTSKSGLAGLSDYVNRRTAATLAEPAPVTPGETELGFYPLIYWPIIADAAPPSGAAITALNDYMSHGGIILIDTRNGGSGEGFAPGTDRALQQIGKGLAIPPLAALTSGHVLARAFYLLQDFPGRFTGDTVWVQRDQDRTNDSVSPVIIGGNDWAAAWAVDDQGHNPYAAIPGGARQRTMAYRFGVNLVMYALTGNYKGDQVHVPALLERLGQ
jgi:hypothetical protein